MNRDIPLYDIGLGESLEVQQQKQKAIAETLGVSIGGGEKLFLIHRGFLVSSVRGFLRPEGAEYERDLKRWQQAIDGEKIDGRYKQRAVNSQGWRLE